MFDTGTDPERNHASGARQKRVGLLEVEVQLATQHATYMREVKSTKTADPNDV